MKWLDLLLRRRAKATLRETGSKKPFGANGSAAPATKARTKRTPENPWCDFPIVGESNYQDALSQICGGRTRDGHQIHTRAQLVPEPSNPHDCNAVRVDIDGFRVGYLKRETATKYVARLLEHGRSGEVVDVRAYISGGWDRSQYDKGQFGVQIERPWPLKRRPRSKTVQEQSSGESL